MADRTIRTESVAVGAEETDPIVLRETDTRRLVFVPMIVANEDPVRGYFVWQRKLKGDAWEDITGETLNSLKAGEGFKLELRSAEVTALVEGVLARKQIYEKHGIEFGERDYVAEAELPEVVRKILEEPDSELAQALQALDPAELLALGRSVDLSKLDALLAEWDEKEAAHEDDEDFSQELLNRNAWVFSQLTGSPVVLLQERAYVGGKDISNTGGGVVDYLIQNELTNNVSLVEIKTPAAELCAREYRGGTYPPGREVVGGVVQVLGYRGHFLGEIANLRGGNDSYRAYNPRCFVIAGRIGSLDENTKIRSFELFRTAQSGVQIIAFDEVRVRLQGIRDVLAVGNAED